MEKFYWVFIAVAVLCLLSEGVESILSPYPLNTVVTAGSSLTLECVTNNTAPVNLYLSFWQFTASNGTYADTIGRCTCGSPPCTFGISLYSNYQFPMPTPQTCNLQISSVQLYQAGQYSCVSSAPTDATVSASIAVVDSYPSCTANFSATAILQDSTIQMTAKDGCYGCNQYFATSITWTPTTGSSPSNTFTNTNVTSVFTSGPAQAPSMPPYYMTLGFTALATGAPPVTATNTNFSSFHLCNFSSVFVAYPPYPNNVAITGPGNMPITNGSALLQYTVLMCSAVTYQEATFTYNWTGPGVPDSFQSGQTLILQEAGTFLTYTCTATDVLPGVGSGSNSITLNITSVATTTSPTTTSSMTPSVGTSIQLGTSMTSIIIGAAVGGGVLFIIIVIIFIVICGRRNKGEYLKSEPATLNPGFAADQQYTDLKSCPAISRGSSEDVRSKNRLSTFPPSTQYATIDSSVVNTTISRDPEYEIFDRNVTSTTITRDPQYERLDPNVMSKAITQDPQYQSLNQNFKEYNSYYNL